MSSSSSSSTSEEYVENAVVEEVVVETKPKTSSSSSSSKEEIIETTTTTTTTTTITYILEEQPKEKTSSSYSSSSEVAEPVIPEVQPENIAQKTSSSYSSSDEAVEVAQVVEEEVMQPVEVINKNTSSSSSEDNNVIPPVVPVIQEEVMPPMEDMNKNTSTSSSSEDQNIVPVVPIIPVVPVVAGDIVTENMIEMETNKMMDVNEMPLANIDQQPVYNEMQQMPTMEPTPVVQQTDAGMVPMEQPSQPTDIESAPVIVKPTTEEPEDSFIKRKLHALRDDPNKCSVWAIVLCVLGVIFPPLLCVLFCATVGTYNHKNVAMGCASLIHTILYGYLCYCAIITCLCIYFVYYIFIFLVPSLGGGKDESSGNPRGFVNLEL